MIAFAIALLVPVLSLAEGAARDEGQVQSVEGTVRVKKRPDLAIGATLTAPAQIDARGGSVEISWPSTNTHLSLAGTVLDLVRVDARGARMRADDVRFDLAPGQALQVRFLPEGRTPKTLLKAAHGNTVPLELGCCQTLVRVPPGSSASMQLDRNGLSVVVQAEAGTVSVVDRDGREQILLAGQRLIDRCIPSPEGIVEPPESRPPFTPFQP